MKEGGGATKYTLTLRFPVQLIEPHRRFGNIPLVEMLDLALAVDDLLQPISRSDGVLWQTVNAFKEREPKYKRSDVRSESRRLGHIHDPKYIVPGAADATQKTFTINRQPLWVTGRRAALEPRAGLYCVFREAVRANLVRQAEIIHSVTVAAFRLGARPLH